MSTPTPNWVRTRLEELEKLGGVVDVLGTMLLGTRDKAGHRIRERPGEYARTPHAWKPARHGKDIVLTPRKLPGGVAKAVVKHPLAVLFAAGLGGAALAQHKRNDRAPQSVSGRKPNVYSFDATTAAGSF